jgi:hypothetical protein
VPRHHEKYPSFSKSGADRGGVEATVVFVGFSRRLRNIALRNIYLHSAGMGMGMKQELEC